MGRKPPKGGYMNIYSWFTLLYSRNQCNTVKQLYFNLKKRRNEWSKISELYLIGFGLGSGLRKNVSKITLRFWGFGLFLKNILLWNSVKGGDIEMENLGRRQSHECYFGCADALEASKCRYEVARNIRLELRKDVSPHWRHTWVLSGGPWGYRCIWGRGQSEKRPTEALYETP